MRRWRRRRPLRLLCGDSWFWAPGYDEWLRFILSVIFGAGAVDLHGPAQPFRHPSLGLVTRVTSPRPARPLLLVRSAPDDGRHGARRWRQLDRRGSAPAWYWTRGLHRS